MRTTSSSSNNETKQRMYNHLFIVGILFLVAVTTILFVQVFFN